MIKRFMLGIITVAVCLGAHVEATAAVRPALRLPPGPLAIDPRIGQLQPLPPIRFIPFRNVDTNGRALPPDSMITLHDGSTARVDEYIRSVNLLEQRLAASGYSLRTYRGPVQTYRAPDPRVELDRQARDIAKGARKISRRFPITRHGSAGDRTASGSDEFLLGRKKTFALALQASGTADAEQNAPHYRSKVNASVYAFARELELVSATVDIAVIKSQVEHNIDIAAVGQHLFSKHGHELNEWSDAGDETQPFNVAYTWTGPCGPIPCIATIGLEGEVKMSYEFQAVSASPASNQVASIHGTLTPALRVNAYGGAGVGASMGYGELKGDISVKTIADLVLVDNTLALHGQARYCPSPLSVLLLARGENSMKALDGHVWVEARLCLSLPLLPDPCQVWSVTLYEWDSGYDHQSRIYDASVWYPGPWKEPGAR